MTTTDIAEPQAKAQLESIRAMLDRLEHARECTNPDCDFDNEHLENYHNEDTAIETIQEGPLSVLVRSDWYEPSGPDSDHSGGPAEFEILLCTGGPAVRIRGELDDNCQPSRAWMEYQDWGTPWTTYFVKAGETTLGTLSYLQAVLAYASHFYYGE